jgi:hypothetical protein
MIIKSDLAGNQLAVAVADLGQEHGASVLLADVDVFTGSVE